MSALAKQAVNVEEAERLARSIHELVWKNREDFWRRGFGSTEIEMLDPALALELLGYSVQTAPFLGRNPINGSEVAGIIDGSRKTVDLSRQYPCRVQRFTSGHELGHAVRHPQLGALHRDRPLDGPTDRRDMIEREADEFSSCYLMPKRMVLRWFEALFGPGPFHLTEARLFDLTTGTSEMAWRRLSCPRNLSLTLAQAVQFGNQPIKGLCNSFKVSPSAMAIRIEQLGLVPT